MMISSLAQTEARLEGVRKTLRARHDEIEFAREPGLAAEVAALGIWREIGTPNDQLSEEVLIRGSDSAVPPECARAELIDHRGNIGVRIWYDHHERLEARAPGLRALLHPTLSFDDDGAIRQLVIFPISVARIARLEEAELVIVPQWALEQPLADDALATHYYRRFASPDNWRDVAQWILTFCDLTAHRRIPFFTTHDLRSHVAGFRRSSWPVLRDTACRLKACVEDVLDECPSPPTHAVILPFLAGYLLDSLAQPLHGDGDRILIVIDVLLEAITARAIRLDEPGRLGQFPQGYGGIVRLTRADSPPTWELRAEARRQIADLVAEIKQHLQA